MKAKFSCISIGFAILLFVLFASSAAWSAPVAGDNEIEVAAGFFHAQGSDTGSLNADLSYGYYFTPGWELGFRQAVNYNFIDNERDAWLATTTPVLNYNFHLNDRVIPFVGGFIGLAWNDRDATGTLGPNAGLKIFLSDQTFLALRYRYEWFFNAINRVGDNADHGNHVVGIGIGFDWGGSGRPTK